MIIEIGRENENPNCRLTCELRVQPTLFMVPRSVATGSMYPGLEAKARIVPSKLPAKAEREAQVSAAHAIRFIMHAP
jgi:hypothetical protein